MFESSAKVSIGLPVYNGEKHLRSALNSLLAQTHSSFELIVSDNASTDRTPDICREYAQQDRRIHLFFNETNIGAANNFNRVFELSSAKYFMWAAHDDLWENSYISKCVTALEQNPSVVLCGTDVRFIDQTGQSVSGRGLRIVGGKYNRLNTLNFDLRRRVGELTHELNWYAIYGVIRSDALRNTELCGGVYGSDVILLMELLLQGESLILPEPLFHYRIQKKSASDQLLDITGHVAQALRASPYTDLARNLLRVIKRSQFANKIKAELMVDLLENVSHRNRRWQKLILKEHPEVNSKNSFERARNIRKLLAPSFVELSPTGRWRSALEDRILRFNEFGSKIRRNFERLKGH